MGVYSQKWGKALVSAVADFEFEKHSLFAVVMGSYQVL